MDELDQNVPYPHLSDPPNIESAMGNLVSAAVPKLNMVFDDANARAATIPSPVAGMECFLKAEKRKEIFDGTAWVTITPSGWIPISYASGYTARAGSPAYRIVNQTVELRGQVQNSGNTDLPTNAPFVIANMPTIARPPHPRFFITTTEWASYLYARIEIQPDGEVIVIIPAESAGAGTPNWVGLDVVRYSLI
ncbi:hypothetical protein [Streptomyces sp. NPDC048603]|uniref:hypothetical protein n=1 Tax=Streptomyces sp. NPDC048603 TaxID=3365577 RepID=UPI003723FF72